LFASLINDKHSRLHLVSGVCQHLRDLVAEAKEHQDHLHTVVDVVEIEPIQRY